MIGFASVEHKAAWVLEKLHTESKAVAGVLDKLAGDEKAIEAVTAIVAPGAVDIERAAFAAAATLAKACDETSTVADAAGNHTLTISVAQADVASYKSLFGELKSEGAKLGLKL